MVERELLREIEDIVHVRGLTPAILCVDCEKGPSFPEGHGQVTTQLMLKELAKVCPKCGGARHLVGADFEY